MNELTPQEREVVEKLAEVWNLFLALPVQHPWDQQEFMHIIHHAQQMILARVGERILNGITKEEKA